MPPAFLTYRRDYNNESGRSLPELRSVSPRSTGLPGPDDLMEALLFYAAVVGRTITWLGMPAEIGLDHLFVMILIPLGFHAAAATYIALKRSSKGC